MSFEHGEISALEKHLQKMAREDKNVAISASNLLKLCRIAATAALVIDVFEVDEVDGHIEDAIELLKKECKWMGIRFDRPDDE